LTSAYEEAKEASDREHVTPYIWKRPDRFRAKSVVHSRPLNHYRLTVDTPEDFELIQRLLTFLSGNESDFSLDTIINVLEQHPDWSKINEGIEQKKS